MVIFFVPIYNLPVVPTDMIHPARIGRLVHLQDTRVLYILCLLLIYRLKETRLRSTMVFLVRVSVSHPIDQVYLRSIKLVYNHFSVSVLSVDDPEDSDVYHHIEVWSSKDTIYPNNLISVGRITKVSSLDISVKDLLTLIVKLLTYSKNAPILLVLTSSRCVSVLTVEVSNVAMVTLPLVREVTRDISKDMRTVIRKDKEGHEPVVKVRRDSEVSVQGIETSLNDTSTPRRRLKKIINEETQVGD